MKKLFSIFAAVLFAGSMMAETITLTMSEIQKTAFTESGITVSTAKNDGSTEPAYNTAGDLRVYAKGSITISAGKNMTGIEFVVSKKGKYRLASLSSNVGDMSVKGDPDWEAKWSGSAQEVTITVGEKATYGTDGAEKAGQLCFDAIKVTLEEAVAPVADGYYLVGDFTEWKLDSKGDYKFEPNTEKEGEYKLQMQLVETEQLKAVEVKDGEIAKWYPEGTDNNIIIDGAHAGAVTVYFQPAGNTDAAWAYGKSFIYIDVNEAPKDLEYKAGYYLVGPFTDGVPSNDYKFALNAEQTEVEEYMVKATLTVGDEIKGVIVDDKGNWVWMPLPGEKKWIVDEANAGKVIIYLRPAGNAEWEEKGLSKYIWIVKDTDPAPTEIDIDVEYADAAYSEEDGDWWFVLYKDYDESTEETIYPELQIDVVPKGASTIIGSYGEDDINYAFLVKAKGDTVWVEELNDNFGISYDAETDAFTYSFAFIGDDKNQYKLNAILDTYAYNYDTEEDIILDEQGGGTPGPEPGELGDELKLVMSDFKAITIKKDGVSVVADKAGGSANPIYNDAGDLRVYAKGTVQITAPKNMIGIEFVISKKGKYRLADLTASVGSMTVKGDPDFTAKWAGKAKEVTITVGEKSTYGTDGAEKAGQLCFDAIIITFEKSSTGVEQIVLGSEATKMIMNGQMLIIRDGKVFNAAGVQIQ